MRRHLRVWAALAFVREALRRHDPSVAAPPATPPGAVELTAALVRKLAARVRDDGGAFAVVVLPDSHESASTRQAASRSGVAATLDLTPAFHAAGAAGEPLFYRLDGAHWTPRAHRLAAAAIAPWLLAGVLPHAPRACGYSRGTNGLGGPSG
jgi:hypothetical protein